MSKRKNVLVCMNTKVFKHSANAKHNEATVVVKKWAIPVKNLLGFTIPPETVTPVLESMRVMFPKARVEFNYNPKVPAFPWILIITPVLFRECLKFFNGRFQSDNLRPGILWSK